MTEKTGKKTILIFNKYYLPGFKAGGPIRSVSNLVSWLGDAFDFRIITRDRDSFDEEPYENIRVDEWNEVGKASVYYVRRKRFSAIYRSLEKEDYDAIYLNSLFNFWFSIIPLFIAFLTPRWTDYSKILLAPRGELSEGALRQKSFKKRLFIKLIRSIGVYKRIRWHATNDAEKEEILRHLDIPADRIFLASNLPQTTAAPESDEVVKKERELRMIYLSRITPKKNLDFALDILNKIDGIDITYDLYGMIDDDRFWQQCLDKIENLPENIDVQYKGIVEYENVLSTMADYHLFFFPTLGENFGHAIYESMISGTPVLISDRTPWVQLEEKGLGYDIPLDEPGMFTEVINRLGNMGQREINEMKRDVRRRIQEMDIDVIVRDSEQMFKRVTS